MDEPIEDLLGQGRDEEVKARINALLQQPAQTPMPPEAAAGVLEAIMATGNAPATPVMTMHPGRKRWLYAACAAVVILLGAVYFQVSRFSHKEPAPEKLAVHTVEDVPPGGNRAVLTLADGSVIDLDKAENGTIAREGKTIVNKKEDGQIAFQGSHSPAATNHSAAAFNTLTTPNGGQYQLVLPDGSRVWLNAASSIRFPTTFTGDRKITMTGEAYFEVAHDAQKPFIVNVNNKEEVVVLGTHFNINGYNNETAIRTTLLQGSVRIGKRQTADGRQETAEGRRQKAGNEQTVVLNPGEQAVLSRTNSPLTIDHSPNLEQVVAWKNGLFNLAGADLKEFMRQVERWYDITVQYDGAVPAIVFQGKLNRAVPLSDIIGYLQNLGLACELVAGKTLHVKSK